MLFSDLIREAPLCANTAGDRVAVILLFLSESAARIVEDPAYLPLPIADCPTNLHT